jgi:hypothetical protein
MSKSRSESYDVFLSSALADRAEANVVKRAFEDRGLSVFSSSGTSPGAKSEDLVHSAISDAKGKTLRERVREHSEGKAPKPPAPTLREQARERVREHSEGQAAVDAKRKTLRELAQERISEDLIHSAISDARMFVAILSRESMDSPNVLFEFGASWGWNKPIYLLLKQGIKRADLMAPFRRHPAFPLSGLDVAIDEIVRGIERLDDRQVKRLGEIYADTGVPVDQLFDDPDEMDKLARRFNRAVGTKLSPERVLQEVIRLRKRGALPKLKQQTG